LKERGLTCSFLDKSINLVDDKGNINQNLTGYYALIPYCSFKELDFCYYAKVSVRTTLFIQENHCILHESHRQKDGSSECVYSFKP
jgi:hypothetical protein